MTGATERTLYRTQVLAEWVDYNGHMNDACYGIVFSRTVDALMDFLGLDADYRARTARSIFTLETHLCFLQEASLGEPLRVAMELLAHDSKRLHVFLSLYRASDETLLATSEQMLLHVDLNGPRGVLFDAVIQERVQQLWAVDAARALPVQAGRAFKALAQSRMA